MSQQQVDLELEVEKFRSEVNRLPRNELVNMFIATYCRMIHMEQLSKSQQAKIDALKAEVAPKVEVVSE